MTQPKRKSIPISTKLAACLRLLGFLPGEKIEWHHDPALGRRKLSADGCDYDPPQLDPAYIVPMRADDHRVQTSGSGATTRGSDIGEIAKTKRLEKRRLGDLQPGPLLKRALKEVAERLPADDKIDTSDIPEVGKAWFERATLRQAKKQWPKRKFQTRRDR